MILLMTAAREEFARAGMQGSVRRVDVEHVPEVAEIIVKVHAATQSRLGT